MKSEQKTRNDAFFAEHRGTDGEMVDDATAKVNSVAVFWEDRAC